MGSKPSNLVEAANKGNIHVVKEMIRKGARINGKDKKETTALHHAARTGNVS